MADRKISQLASLATPDASDYLPIVDISEPADTDKNKRVTVEGLLRGAPDGTAASPGIAFASDLDTGIYRAGANSVAVSTGGTGRLFVTSNGNVGVATAQPAAPLQVGTGNTTPSTSKLIVNTSDAVINGITVSNWTGSSTSNGPRIGFDNSTHGLFSIGGGNGVHSFVIRDEQASSDRLTIDSSGRLLVGTSSTSLECRAVFQGTSSFPTLNADVYLQTGTAVTSVVSGSNLGVLSFAASGSRGAFILGAGDGTWASSSFPTRLVFSTTADGASTPTERLRINNVGKFTFSSVSDGTDALVINHNGSSGNQFGVTVVTANDQNTSTNFFYRGMGSATVRCELRANGGLANYSANNVNLSDRNVKKDIALAASTWNCLKEWEIVNFRYKDQSDDIEPSIGVIAQQLAESCPEVIAIFQEAKEATETTPAQEEQIGVKEQQVVWMAIKALQEAQLRIETLEAKVAALEAS